MYICRSLLDHGYFSFSLQILEYCDPSLLIERENYYFKLFKPEYNLIKEAGSPPMLGLNHSDETKSKIGVAQPLTQKIEVHDLELEIKTIYPSIRSAASSLNISKTSIIRYIQCLPGISRGTPVLGRYTFKKID